MLFSKEKVVASRKNLDNYTYDLTSKARVLPLILFSLSISSRSPTPSHPSQYLSLTACAMVQGASSLLLIK